MEVYFDRSFWESGRGDREYMPGVRMKLDKNFCYGGFQWQAPAAYLCREGIVVDICRRISEKKLKEFYDIWGHWTGREEELTQEQLLKCERENPLEFSAEFCVQINGSRLKNSRSSSLCLVPSWMEEGRAKRMAACEAEELLTEEYGLDRKDGWQVFRCSFRYGEESEEKGREGFLRNLEDFKDHAAAEGERLKPSVKELLLTVSCQKTEFPCGTFVTEPGSGKDDRTRRQFFHPVTGKPIELEILGCRQYLAEIPESFSKGFRMPKESCLLEYCLKTDMMPGERFHIHDCSQGNGPVRIEKAESDGRDRKEKAAVAVSIIGGCDGPVSLFFAGKAAENRVREEVCQAFSSLYFEPVKQIQWQAAVEVALFEPETFSLV